MIKVSLINPESRRFYQAQWDDPITGLTKTRSTKETDRRRAERFAAILEKELNSGEFKQVTDCTWEELKDRYGREVSAPKARKTRQKTDAMWNAIDRLFSPKMVSAVANPGFISKFAAAMREETINEEIVIRKDYTIRGHLAELRKVLRWAKEMEIIHKVPIIRMPPKSKGMKGRPITTEEFDRMVAVIPKVVEIEFATSWNHYLRGLWCSSLRLDESMKLHWTNDQQLAVDFSHRHPMFRIQAASEKGRQFRLLPMTPDFAAFLNETPARDRRGFVFNPLSRPRSRRTGTHRPTAEHCGKIISDIGEKAGVKVNETKFASAHDFRRAFGFRWAKLVMPKILQELMRHAAIQTTMEFYVGTMAEDAADEVWKASKRAGNTSGNNSSNSPSLSEESQVERHQNT